MPNVDIKKWGPLIVVLSFNYLLWGSAMSFGKLALEAFNPLFLVGARLIIAFLVFTPIVLLRFWPVRVAKKDIPVLILLVLCDPTGFFMFEALGLQYTAASQASMMCALAPLLNVVAAWIILRERVSLRTFIAFIIAVGGVSALTLSSEQSSHATNPLLGNFFIFLSLCCSAAFFIIIRSLGGRYPATMLVWIQCLGSSLIFTPIILLNPDCWPTSFEPGPTLSMIYLGIGVTFLAQFTCAYGLAHLTVTRMSTLSNLIPVIGLIFAIVMLGETLTLFQWTVCAVILGAVLVSQLLQNREAKAIRLAQEEAKNSELLNAVNSD